MSKLQEILDKMGLTMEYEDIPEDNVKLAKIRDPKNPLKSADTMFEVSNNLYKDVKTIEPKGVFFPNEWQGQGLATELYKELENITGGKIVPGDDQTEKSFGLHEKRGFGKEFGLKESTLNKLMSPNEKKERDIRKEALRRGLESLSSEMEGLSKKGVLPKDLALDEYKSDIDNKLLGNIDSRNAPSIMDNIIMQARKLPSAGKAAEFIKDNIPSSLSKVKSIAPFLTGGAGLVLSAASEASDSPEAGDILGQDALERDIKASKQMKQIEGSDVSNEVKLKALELFKKNKLPY